MKFPDSHRLKASRIYWNYATTVDDSVIGYLFPVVNWWSQAAQDEMQIVVLPHERVPFINFVFVFSPSSTSERVNWLLCWICPTASPFNLQTIYRQFREWRFLESISDSVGKWRRTFISSRWCCCCYYFCSIQFLSSSKQHPRIRISFNSRSSRQWTHPRDYQSMRVRRRNTHELEKGAKWEEIPEKKTLHSDGNLISLKRRIAKSANYDPCFFYFFSVSAYEILKYIFLKIRQSFPSSSSTFATFIDNSVSFCRSVCRALPSLSFSCLQIAANLKTEG